MPLSSWAPAFRGALILRESVVLVLHLQPWRIGRGEVFSEKFSWRSFHLAPNIIHPLVANSRCVGFSTSALLTSTLLKVYCIAYVCVA